MSWVRAASVGELHGKPIVFHHPPRQISLFKVGARVFAVDNRCPHERYPLSLGHVGAGGTGPSAGGLPRPPAGTR